VARGFDSKSVTDQQEEAEQARERRTSTPAPAAASTKRKNLELARADLLRRIDAAPESRRAELKATLSALDELIRRS
jgi:hypothetical protein